MGFNQLCIQQQKATYKQMGCTNSAEQVVQLIPQPTGPPVDPLLADGDIIELIANDPHINFYQKKLQEVILPLRKQKQQQKTQKTDKTKKTENKKNVLNIERFATADKQQHKKYVDTVNNALQGNDASVTNIMAYMMEEMADMREGKSAHDKFKADSYAALKCFIYLYTGHYSYKKINSQLRRNQYDKISQVIAVVKKQLEQYNKEKFARKLKANIKFGKFLSLYRGIPKPDKAMQKGAKLYWKAFTSTSLDTTVASRFGRYMYIITLDNSNPHRYMIVPEELSQFKQEQIILFPYFYFECDNVENFTSGARYECKQLGCEE